MKDKSLDAILADFNPMDRDSSEKFIKAGTVTIWLDPEYKSKYDRIQEKSQRRFGKKLRELVRAAIDRCETEAKAS